jgi:hypothetical protein
LVALRTLCNCAQEHRKPRWGRGAPGHGIGATYSQQAREVPGLSLKAACPQFAEVRSQVLQHVLRRVDKTYQAFVR